MIREELLEEPSPAISVERIQDAIGLHGLRVPWMNLWQRASENPFLTWSWMEAAWTRVTPSRRPLVLTAWTGKRELVGVLPLSIRSDKLARVCSFFADDTVGSDYLDALVDPRFDEAVRRALWTEALALQGSHYDALELHELDADGPSVELLRGLGRFETIPGYQCPHIQISGDFATYLKGVSRSDNLKRKKKQLEKLPGYRVDVARTPEAVGAALDDFFRLHAARWASDGGSQGVTGPRVERFHREVVRRFAHDGDVRLYTLKVEDRAIASVYMLGKGDTRYFYQSGYDPAYAKNSPGLVLLAKTIEDAFAEGAKDYDFLHGSEPYKFEWANAERKTLSLSLVVPTLRGRVRAAGQAAVGRARALAHGALGERGYDVLRKLRRRLGRA